MELSREHYRAMIYYDFKVGLSEHQCIERLQQAFGEEAPSRASVFRWYAEFKRGRSSLSDEARPGRPCSSVTPENIAKVQRLIEEDPRCTYQMIEETLGIGSATVHTILHEHLHLKKVVMRWVPHQLTDFQKAERVRICRETLKMLNDGGHRIISKIITGDETYISFYDVPTRQESRVWIHEDAPTPVTVKKQRSVKKIMYAVFFRSTGLVKAIKLKGQRSVTANWYVTECLPEVLGAVKIRGLILHQDNASSHTAQQTIEYLRQNKVTVLEHPPYSPDLAMCDFWLFNNLKKNLRGRKFSSEDEIDQAIHQFFADIPKSDWLEAFHLWKIRMQKCIDIGGDYFEHH